MERILVSINRHHIPREALFRSLALAKRINAQLYVLTVLPEDVARMALNSDLKPLLDQYVQKAAEDGLHVESFLSRGNFEQEVINFILQKKITLLVTEQNTINDSHDEREWASLRVILHKAPCRVEVITARKFGTKRG